MIGDVYILGSGAAHVACWPSKEALDRANQAMVANDDEGFQQLVVQYAPLALPAGTRVRILDDEPFAGHIEGRVLSGVNEGAACWYPFVDESNKDGKFIAKRVSSRDTTEEPASPSPVAAQTDNAAPQKSLPTGGVVIYAICSYGPSACGASGDWFDETRPQDLTYAREYQTCLNTDSSKAQDLAELRTRCAAKAGIAKIQFVSNYSGPVVKVSAQTDNAAPQISSGNAQQNATSVEIADSPLSAGDVLPLLRATSALSVSMQANGATAYVTVPNTPARGTVDPNRIWVGRIADGRWVGIVPLDSGGSAGIAYALMWVWTDGRAHFVGEIPAENGGLGQLSMSIENGVIHLQWPMYRSSDTKCCPSLVRTKILTLDGTRLRPLSDTTAPAGRAP